jgi:hypothetical protein
MLYFKADVDAYVVEDSGANVARDKSPDPASRCKQKGRVQYTPLERGEM